MSRDPSKVLARRILGAALLLFASGLSAAQITEYPLPQPGSRPVGITLGPDGNIWFTEQGANQIGRLTPAGVLTEFPVPTAGSGPSFITAGPDGNLWFTEHSVSGNKIGRITPAGVITEFPLPTPDSRPDGITVGSDGALWFTELNGARVGRITTSGQITEFPLKPNLILPLAITTGPDANLWITVLWPPTIVRMTPQGSMTSFPLPTLDPPADDAFQITPGPGGDLWFTNRTNRSIGKITTDGVVTLEVVMVPGVPHGITRGPDGAIWFHQGDRVSEISEIVGVRDYVSGGTSPGYITAGADGAMWITLPDDNKVLRLDHGPVIVNDAGDDLHATGCAATGEGICTLRDALTWSGASPLPETFHFAIPGPGLHTISPLSALPGFGDVILDATTQPGYADHPLIELNGTGAGAGTSGLVVNGGGVAIRGFVINRFAGDGIRLEGTSANSVVQANWIGTDASGLAAAPNGGSGIFAVDTSGNTIGGASTAHRNVISGNGEDGITFQFAPGNRVFGNFIGVNRTGTAALGNNGDGILIHDGSDNLIGDLTAVPGSPPGNVISGNAGAGVHPFVFGSSTSRTFVKGNLIGTNAAGTAALGNGAAGVHLQGTDGCVIGGFTPGGRNVISGNTVGVELGRLGLAGTRRNVVTDNLIGTDISGNSSIGNLGCGVSMSGITLQNRIGEPSAPNRIAFNGGGGVCVLAAPSPAFENTVSANEIFSNGGLGIDLAPTGVNANGHCDGDDGANGLQNFPILKSISSGPGTTIVRGTLQSGSSRTFRIEFFRNAACDPSGFGEGESYLFATSVTTDSSCRAAFDVIIPITLDPTSVITATATDPAGNTSEFSPCVSAATDFFTLPPCRVADTRGTAGPYGAPALSAGAVRNFAIAGRCGVPLTARAIAANVTVVGPQATGHVVVFPANQGLPGTSTVNYRAGQDRANNAIVVLDSNGEVSVSCAQPSGTVDFILDVVGYFD